MVVSVHLQTHRERNCLDIQRGRTVNKYIFLSVLFLLASCGTDISQKANAAVQVKKILSENFCSPSQSLLIIDADSDLSRQPITIAQAITRYQPDWSQEQLLLINMGQQANLGYSLGYIDGARLEKLSLVIPVEWNQPESGRMYAQMIVQPCLLLSIPKQGYNEIIVLDQNGTIRFQSKNIN